MSKSDLSLIEEAINNKKDESILKISSKFNMDNSQTILFLKYFNKFNILSSLLDSNYVNYFNKIALVDLREKDEITDENFAKAISIFIKEKRKNKKLYYVSLQTHDDIDLQIKILSKLDYKSLKYEVSYNNNLDLKNDLNIFNYITNINDDYPFRSLMKYLVENLIDAPYINTVDLDKIPYDIVLKYSTKYPNKIKYLDLFEFKDYDKVKVLMELNKDSLLGYPHGKLQYLIPLKNANYFNLSNLCGELDNNFDFSHIVNINNISIDYNNEYDKAKELIVKLLNKCPNVEELAFWDICSDSLFYILENIDCHKMKKISATCEDIEADQDWSKVFEKMPLLEILEIEEHQTMCWTYYISPVFLAETKRLDFPLLEQLIRNYLNGNPERFITLEFDYEFDEFWDYFKDKKDIISRVSKLSGNNYFETIDSYFKAIITSYDTIDRFNNAKYYYCIVETPFSQKVLEFVKRNKIEYLFILNDNYVNIDELKKIDELKFVFCKSSKIFLYRNKNNNMLESI